MEFKECVLKRMSVRAFKPDPVDKATVEKLIELSLRSPSWGNTQPWEIVAVSGDKLKGIVQGFLDRAEKGIKPNPDVEMPVEWPEINKRRYIEVGKALLTTMGIAREDKAGRERHMLNMYRLFGAPLAVYLMFDSALNLPYAMLDMGLITQTLCLTATDLGIGSCIMAATVHYPEVIREVVGLSKEKKLAIGIALGYPDLTAKANSFRSTRAPLSEVFKLVGV